MVMLREGEREGNTGLALAVQGGFGAVQGGFGAAKIASRVDLKQIGGHWR